MYQVLSPDRRSGSATLGVVLLVAALLAGCSSSGARSGDPSKVIKVGYTNRESATGALPEWRHGGLAAIDYINAHGGINGATIKPTVCLTDGSPEASIKCANQFVDEGVALEFMGLDVGSDAGLPILASAGIPFVATIAGGTAQLSDPNSFMFSGTGPDAASLLQAFKNEGATRITVAIYAGIPSVQALFNDTVKPIAARLGLQATALAVPYTNPDWTASVASALSDPPDAFLLALKEDDCTSMLRALKANSYQGVTAAFSCSRYLTTLGANAPTTLASVTAWTPDLRQHAPQDIGARLEVYQNAMKAVGHEDLVNTGGASRTFSAWMQLADILRGSHDPITAASVKKALETASNVPGYLGPDLHCGQKVWPTEPSVCTAAELPLRIVTHGNTLQREPIGTGFVDVSDLAG